jgi:hypothetical protein
METVYLETSFISYLVALPSRDLIVAAHQQVTNDWWNHQKNKYECYISEIVIDESSAGDEKEIQKRLTIIDELKLLDLTQEVDELTKAILKSGVIPPKAVRDAAHIAVATVHEVDYLLTWNCTHIANAHILKRIEKICILSGFQMPTICTPENLLEDIKND